MTIPLCSFVHGRGQIPYILYYNVLPSLEVGAGGAPALVGDVVDGGLTTAPAAAGSRVSAISLQSSKALQELVARRTVLAVMSHVVQVIFSRVHAAL